MALRVLYPGSFDPVTFGHLDLIRRAASMFDEVIVAVAHTTAKQPLFTVSERVALLRQATRGIRRVSVEDFSGLMVAYARQRRVAVVLRGVRMVSDFENEFQMALTNRRLNSAIEIIYMMPQERYFCLSSSLIKEIARLGADLSEFVPPVVERQMKKKISLAAAGDAVSGAALNKPRPARKAAAQDAGGGKENP